MRLINGPHGVAGASFTPMYAGRSLGSASVILAWSRGLSRKYQAQTRAHRKLMAPKMMNDPRQLIASISQVTSGGVTALPTRAKAWVIPCAKPRFPIAVQFDIARVAVGNVAPSPRPSRIRARTIDTSPPAKPVSTVAPAQMNEQIVNVRRGPNRSPIQPPII